MSIAENYETRILKEINATLECTKGAKQLSSQLKIAINMCHNNTDFSLLHAWNSKIKGSDFHTMLNSNQRYQRCNRFEDIIDWVMLEYSSDICILQSIKWMDQDFNVIQTNIDDDITNVLNGVQVVGDYEFRYQ